MKQAPSLALITGASSGIGASFARQLAAGGHNLVLVSRRTDRLAALAAELTAHYGIAAEAMTADLTLDQDVTRVALRLGAAEDLVLLINNAGFATRAFFFEADAAAQDAMQRLHVIAPERLTRAVLPGMIRRGQGAIINVASIAAFAQSAGNVGYCASKTWLKSFTEGLWLELRAMRSAVVVQALCPGFTYSELHDVMGLDRGFLPKRWWMSADDVVAASLRHLRAGTVVVVPGWRYKLLVRVAPRIPRSWLALAARRARRRS